MGGGDEEWYILVLWSCGPAPAQPDWDVEIEASSQCECDLVRPSFGFAIL